MEYHTVLKTILQKGKPRTVEHKRRILIQEAISWAGGTIENPLKIIITSLPGDIDVFFLKPGKEAANSKRPNPHDMTPIVGDSSVRWRFDEIWAQISRISLVDIDLFKGVLTLIYRNAYLLDHVEVNGTFRYLPKDEIIHCIEEIDKEIDGILPFGLMGLLHFLDLLGWNEDVKYHTESSIPTFKGKYDFNVGRINTLLSCIRVPYQTSDFVKHIIDNSNNMNKIDFLKAYETMQQLAKSRGTCTPTQTMLLEWSEPYIVRK